MKLLIVDDDAGICQMLCRVLGADGHEVGAVASGAEALAWLERQGAELVFLDYHLPDLDAPAVLAQARARGWEGPVVVMTGRADQEDGTRLLQAGACALLEKPFDLRRVRSLVQAPSRPSGPAGEP